MRNTTNLKVRIKTLENDLYYWELAEMLGIAESVFWKCFRVEWPEELQDDVCDFIDGVYRGTDASINERVREQGRTPKEVKQERRLSRLMDSVKETELRREREREEWQIMHEKY